MRYLVTGGCGFIGSHLVGSLLSQSNEVIVYDNLSSGRLDFLAPWLGNPCLEVVVGDLLQRRKLWNKLKDIDFVMHLAANPDIREGIRRTSLDLEQNTVATHNVLEGMRRCDVGAIALASSSTVYGRPTRLPTPEDYGPLLPESLYGASKLASEGLVSSFSATFGIKGFIFRFANIVGSRATHGVLVDFLRKLTRERRQLEVLGDGKQRKSFLKVDECIDAMLFVAENAKERLNVLNLGSEDQVTVSEIARLTLEAMGLSDTAIHFTGGSSGWPGDVPEMLLDTAKLKKMGWHAKRTSTEAVREALEELLSTNREGKTRPGLRDREPPKRVRLANADQHK